MKISVGPRLSFWTPIVSLPLSAVVFLQPALIAHPLAAIAAFLVLVAAVFASVEHADVVSHSTGEPYGTLILTVAITVIEVSLIVFIMLAGDGTPALARDTVFAVLMVVCNGLVGLCLIVGGFKYGEQGFRLPGVSAYLMVLMPLATLTLVLPSYTTSVAGPFYSIGQLAFVSAATLALYAVFLYVQTIRHRDYFLSDAGVGVDKSVVMGGFGKRFWVHVLLLLCGLCAIVLLAKGIADSLKTLTVALGAPLAALGLLLALLVLPPESVAALRAARRNELQKSINLALGSSLASIGLTIPAVAVVATVIDRPLALGLELRDVVLLVLTFAVSLLTFAGGRTNILPGFVHLVLFGTFVFLVFSP
jgi:Ca2+:H+ antiporter